MHGIRRLHIRLPEHATQITRTLGNIGKSLVVFSTTQLCIHFFNCRHRTFIQIDHIVMTTLRNTSLRRVSCKLTVNTMCLCLGPKGSGKTLLLKKLQNWEAVDTMSSTVPTIGTNLVAVPLGNRKEITIREIGGAMSPIWRNYYYGIESIMYVVDASNLCQISAAGVLLYTILAEPCLQKAKV